MKVSIFLEDRKVSTGKALPVEAICGGIEHLPEGRKFFHWAEAQAEDEIEGVDVLVTGISYGINRRRYDLSSGYAIKARLTEKNTIIPYLRKSEGKEVQAIKTEDGVPICDYWPIVVRTWIDEPKLEEKQTKSVQKDFSYFVVHTNERDIFHE
jgi:hypothetical protein